MFKKHPVATVVGILVVGIGLYWIFQPGFEKDGSMSYTSWWPSGFKAREAKVVPPPAVVPAPAAAAPAVSPPANPPAAAAPQTPPPGQVPCVVVRVKNPLIEANKQAGYWLTVLKGADKATLDKCASGTQTRQRDGASPSIHLAQSLGQGYVSLPSGELELAYGTETPPRKCVFGSIKPGTQELELKEAACPS